eukprot:XP_011601486.1 PREDICTED: opioid growth factor receptor-like protein 1 [Takifugu rubripes]
MGNLLGSWRFKEPSTIEECDSTWGSDSESEEPPPAEDDSGISDSVSPADSDRAGGDASPQMLGSPQSLPKMKRSFYAARDLYKYRHSYPVCTHTRVRTHTHTDKSYRCSELSYIMSRHTQEIHSNLQMTNEKPQIIPEQLILEAPGGGLQYYICSCVNIELQEITPTQRHNHTYIQWLFPLREQGLNFYAHELTQDEIKEFQSTREAKRRFLVAYSLMLDFYGVKLLDKSGNVARAPNWQERFRHLNESQHNYLRITRILKSLGELGYESFKAPLVRLFLEESLCHSTLPNMQHSILEYFVYTIRLPATRRRLLRYARQHYRPAHAFLWGPLPKRQRGVAGGNVGAGSSGIRAPAPSPEQQRRGEESITSGGSGINVSFHDSMR